MSKCMCMWEHVTEPPTPALPCSYIGPSLSLKHTRPDPAQAPCTDCSFSRSALPTPVAAPTSSPFTVSSHPFAALSPKALLTT